MNLYASPKLGWGSYTNPIKRKPKNIQITKLSADSIIPDDPVFFFNHSLKFFILIFNELQIICKIFLKLFAW